MRVLKYTVALIVAFIVTTPAAANIFKKHNDLYFFPKPEVVHYDEKMLDAVELAIAKAGKRSHRHCWRAVKNALFGANVVPFRPTTKYAWQAGEELEQKFSFIKLEVTDPFEAPIGAVLVYGGPGSGHVEIRTANGFVSDFTATKPSRRPLIGVYVKV